MISEFGQIFLLLTLFAAAFQAVFPLIGAATGDGALTAVARSAALVQLLCVVAAFAVLTVAHGTSDFSVLNVFENSHTAKPFVYKLSGVWGNHEGSMLLWILILAGFGGAVALDRTLPEALAARTLSIQAMIALAFLAFLIFTSNPFERLLPAPPDGQDLNPLLQDPGLAIHPPFLYLGYVGFSIVFAFAAAGLLEGRIDQAWGRAVRPYALWAWVFLTIGIGLGSWWAYYELGWGGFWAWDPVENASFMPWLAGAALIHSVRVLSVRGAFKSWTAFLAILTFSLSLVGTFLVRSGILTSVHAFAVDPTRGVFILAILAVAVGGALTLFAVRAPALVSDAKFQLVSREGGILFNNIVVTVACATVFVGTFYPLFAEIATGEKLSVGAPYFNIVFAPFAMATLLVAPIATAMAWRKGDTVASFQRIWPAALAALGGLAIAAWLASPKTIVSLMTAALAVWAVAATGTDLVKRVKPATSGALGRLTSLPRSMIGMSLAHIGLGIVALGVVGVGAWKSDVFVYAQPGDTISIGGHEAVLTRVEDGIGPNYRKQTAHFDIQNDGRTVKQVAAEKRFYPVRGMQTTEAGIWTSAAGDLYFTLGDYNPERGYVIKAWHHPLTIWMWIGAGIMALGGIVSAWPNGQPVRRKTKTDTPAKRAGQVSRAAVS
ncbi:MAG: heme lyase CcmF/NrfE family subunit [Pseudomonadota bacterium]